MSERIKFVGRLLDGERMADVCRDFGISRKTGYKIYNRFQDTGLEGLNNQSRLPKSRSNQTAVAIERLIVQVRRDHPTWGAPKIKAYLEKRRSDIAMPARSTIHAILDRYDLVKKKVRHLPGYRAEGTNLTSATAPNQIWCADFKGQFRLGNSQYCYPLTVTDQFSRYLLGCEALENTKENACLDVFDQLFEEYGLPSTIRSDNGVPFASASHFGLSRLSVFWLRNGIKLERIEPGHPEQNGRHERMHKTLKAETTKPPSSNILSQQERFEGFKEVFNVDRPHQALDMKSPSDIYTRSDRAYERILSPLEYSDHDMAVTVSNCGTISKAGQFRVYLGTPFSGYKVGVRHLPDDVWQVSFMEYDLGYFDSQCQKIKPGKNPFLIKPEL